MPESYHYVANDFYALFLMYAFYGVESFFFLSGLLATLSLYRGVRKYGNMLSFMMMSYLMRFLRIAPMMMFTTMIWMTVLDQLPYGYHVQSRHEHYDQCKDQWYKILFFYGNLTLNEDNEQTEQACMPHLWYLQCDMQMFLLLPVLLWIFSKRKVYGLIAATIPIVICLAIRIHYAFHYDFVANSIMKPYTAQHDKDQSSDSHFKPWTLMGVYFVAVALAMIMILIDESRKQKFVLKAWQYWACISMAAFIMLSLVFWPHQDLDNAPEDRWSHTANRMYYTFGGTAWVCHFLFFSVLCFQGANVTIVHLRL